MSHSYLFTYFQRYRGNLDKLYLDHCQNNNFVTYFATEILVFDVTLLTNVSVALIFQSTSRSSSLRSVNVYQIAASIV